MKPGESTMVTGISQLVTNDPTHPDGDGSMLGIIDKGAVVVQDDIIQWVGRAVDAPPCDALHALEGNAVIPGFVDSHSHLVFAGDRSAEFCARMAGETYDGGGIANTVQATREASDSELRTLVEERMFFMRAQGTTTVEIKTGYGLTKKHELRSLRIASEFTDETTFLGAHVVPPEHADDRAKYLRMVCEEMMPEAENLARWVDVFCEPASAHAFTGEESEQVLQAGAAAGLGLRVHGNQLGHGPGVQLAVKHQAAAVDHCTYLTDDDIAALAATAEPYAAGWLGKDVTGCAATEPGPTVATLLPGVEFSTKSPYPDARKLWDAGVSLALATDCNPGTCYSTSMTMMITLAVREMGLTAAEALWAATAGGAIALRRKDIGRIVVGCKADLAMLRAPSYVHIPYQVGVPLASILRL